MSFKKALWNHWTATYSSMGFKGRQVTYPWLFRRYLGNLFLNNRSTSLALHWRAENELPG